MKSVPLTTLAAATAALLPFSFEAHAQEGGAVQPEALKVLEDAFAYYQSHPVQFVARSEIAQAMGERKNEMVITQRITAAKGAISVVGTAPDYPTPTVHFADGTATVIFDEQKSYVQVPGIKDFDVAYKSRDLGYDPQMGENTLVGATPAAALFEKMIATDAAGRKALIGSLAIDGEKVVSGVAGHRLVGLIQTNPVGLPIENALVPFELVIATGDTPLLLSYQPDSSGLIEEFKKTRPQLGDLSVTMVCSFTDWKTGAQVDASQLALPDVSSFKKFDSFGDLMVAMQSGGGDDASSLKGKPAPDFELATADGGKFKLSDEMGKNVVVLDFWATWCGPCVQAMPIIDRVTKAYAAKGVKLVAVNLRETEKEVEAFMKQHGLAPIVAMDRDGATAEKYLVTGIPQTVIIGKDGNIAEVHVGLIPTLEEQLTSELEDLTK